MRRPARWIIPLAITTLAWGCSPEARQVGPTTPQTAPIGDNDARVPGYQANYYQVSQGGRYFAWYGCSGCHSETGNGVLNLADSQWKYGFGFDHVYRAIAARHGRLDYGTRIPVEVLWQLTAYVRDLPGHFPEKRRRLAVDARAEPVGASWQGPQ